jgi:hypothetical protein
MHRLLGHARGNFVAYLALFVALGGTSYAAIKLPANSVGNRQLSRGAVSSTKVKDRSLLMRDFRRGQLRAGSQGARGPVGLRGPAGSQGGAGPSDTWAHAMNTGFSPGAATTSFALGPGRYEYRLGAYFINGAAGPVNAGCYEGLSAGGAAPVRFEANYAKTTVPGSGGYGSVAKEGVLEITDSKTLDLGCDDSVTLTVGAYATVTKVGALH